MHAQTTHSSQAESSNAAAAAASRIAPGRRRWILGLAATIVVGHFVDIATSSEHWPFSRYQMYSRLPGSRQEIAKLRLFGLTADGREFPLTAERHLPPFNMSRLSLILARLGEYRHSPQRLAEAMHNLASLYESARQSGHHQGPPLVGLRVYQFVWSVQPWAENVAAPRRVLLVEAQTHVH